MLFFVADFIVKRKIEAVLQNELPQNVSLTYKRISINLLGRNASIKQVDLKMKDEAVNLKFSELELNNYHLIKLLFSDTIHIEECYLNNPKIFIDRSQKKISKNKNNSNKKNKIIIIDNFSINNAELNLKNKLGKKVLSFNSCNAGIKDVLMESNPKEVKEITYKLVSLNAEKFIHQIDDVQILNIKKITADQDNLTAENLRIDLVKNKAIQMNYIKEGNDLLTLQVKELKLNSYSYTVGDLPEIKSKNTSILQPEFIVYNHLYSQKVNVKRKPLYSERIRNLNIKLDFEKIEILNGTIVYEEHDQLSNLPGKISISKLNATVKNFKNKDSINDLVVVDGNFNFMDVAPSIVNWTTRMYSPADGFTFKGHIKNLDADRLNLFTVNTINLKSEGKIEEVYFNFKGNDYSATGNMDMNFKDFKVLLLKENSKKERKFINTIVNIFTKRKDKEKDKRTNTFSVVRDQNKSFFNLVWLCLKEGLFINMSAIKNSEIII